MSDVRIMGVDPRVYSSIKLGCLLNQGGAYSAFVIGEFDVTASIVTGKHPSLILEYTLGPTPIILTLLLLELVAGVLSPATYKPALGPLIPALNTGTGWLL